MRLIDADEIIKLADDSVSQYGHTYSADMLNIFGLFKHIIDNAPTVKTYCYFCGQTEHGQIEERPKGKWNEIQSGMLVCPFCGAMPHKYYKNFCAKCGADMRKGGAEE